MSQKLNPNDPVTRGEFDEAMQIVKSSFDHVTQHTNEVRDELKGELAEVKEEVAEVKGGLAEVREELNEVKRVVETILSIVQSLDAQKKEQRSLEDIPDRVDHLEEDVFKIKAKVFSKDR